MAILIVVISLIPASKALSSSSLVAMCVFLSVVSISALLIYIAFRTTTVSLDRGMFEFCYRLFGVPLGRSQFELQKLFIVGQVVGQRYQERVLAVYGKTDARKVFLANEHSCNDIEGLYDWMASVSGVESKDCRHRTIA